MVNFRSSGVFCLRALFIIFYEWGKQITINLRTKATMRPQAEKKLAREVRETSIVINLNPKAEDGEFARRRRGFGTRRLQGCRLEIHKK